MEQKSDTPKKPAESREDRLKAALKANLSRRKAQARARSAGKTPQTDETTEKD
ncbi:hypothetical protein [Pseudoprimorskyibacter insulae]|uniref:hypothetical protein n=1 Tax=Pseudoprimorskyibacter insulae TaxID=1695997 RepID=UPI0015E841A4|nr:hypothetical protein [Pseudoprimorskyibacter insulae]